MLYGRKPNIKINHINEKKEIWDANPRGVSLSYLLGEVDLQSVCEMHVLNSVALLTLDKFFIPIIPGVRKIVKDTFKTLKIKNCKIFSMCLTTLWTPGIIRLKFIIKIFSHSPQTFWNFSRDGLFFYLKYINEQSLSAQVCNLWLEISNWFSNKKSN